LSKLASPEPRIIATWTEWFALLADFPDDTRLSESLDVLAQHTDYVWSRAEIEAIVLCLNDLSDYTVPRKLIWLAVEHLSNACLNVSQFPRTENWYAEWYEALRYWLMTDTHVNETNSLKAIRLTDALLRREPHRCDESAHDFAAWFASPRLVLESVALDACEMLVDYGVRPELLHEWYRIWINHLLAVPFEWNAVAQKVWLLLGNWIQPGNDLLIRLEHHLEVAKSTLTSDGIANLPEGFKIAIFTLDEASANRAHQLFLERNPRLEINGYHNFVSTKRGQQAAQTADAVIIVTACIKHAITYDIMPTLRRRKLTPIHVNSRGSTGIVRAFESYLVDN